MESKKNFRGLHISQSNITSRNVFIFVNTCNDKIVPKGVKVYE